MGAWYSLLHGFHHGMNFLFTVRFRQEIHTKVPYSQALKVVPAVADTEGFVTVDNGATTFVSNMINLLLLILNNQGSIAADFRPRTAVMQGRK